MDGQLALRLNTYLSGVEAGLFPASHGPDNNYQPKITNLALDTEYGGRRSFVSQYEDTLLNSIHGCLDYGVQMGRKKLRKPVFMEQ